MSNDDKIENDLYRENLKIAPVVLRIGAYFIDMILVVLILSFTISQEQQDKVARAYESLLNLNKLELDSNNSQNLTTTRNLDSNPDNSKILNDIRKEAKEAIDVVLIYLLVCALLNILYNFIFLYYYGASLGQIIVKIKVVNVYNFDKPSLHTCMKRSVLKYILGTSLLIGFFPAFVDRFNRTFYDRMSKTIVISN
ncbi:RDD family protein [Helicobacter saguini]|uniref:RDD family protein n=2 Tax=Helicobacter saguini TaxID=1548018 RepID=A0A347VU49_9HELI|nr:RDD family protein [Helicobacter saguini]MWV66330.1 RDD family protein [Helicobacter saguini]MWV68682.1 RDD family protein [Helicobacter saguini]MWV71767.1 RDD family protein [Helicobacter saguini]TLD95991.1 RDD family protein [Helicobacter saguini]